MKKSDELKAKIADYVDHAEKLVNTAEAAGRELTKAEQKQFNDFMAAADALQTPFQEALQTEEGIARMRLAKTIVNTPNQCYTSDGKEYFPPAPQVKSPQLKAFAWAGNAQAAERTAYDAGLWFMGRVRGESSYLEKYQSRCGNGWFATQNETSPSSGGYLVPPDVATTIMQSMQDVGVAPQVAKVVDVKSETFSYPKVASGTTVYYPSEESSLTPSSMDFGKVNLVMRKRAIYSLVSNELREDSLPAIMDILFTDMAYQLAKQQDSEMVAGDGTSTYGLVSGIKNTITAATASLQSATTGNDTWPEITIADFGLLMSKLPAKYRQQNNLKFLCSPAFKWGCLDRLALAQGGALATNVVDGQPRNYFLGHEVVLSDDMPTTTATNTLCCIFGNFDRGVLLGRRSDIRLATSEHIAFQTDQTAVRCTARWDIAVHEAGDTSNAGAIVGLKTAS